MTKFYLICFQVSGVTIETPSIRCMRPHVNNLRGNTSFYLPPTVLSVPPMRKEENGIFERACSSQEVNNFISDELQPNKEFHSLYNDAINSLYEELQNFSPNTFYGIHNLIEVSGETAPNSKGAGVVPRFWLAKSTRIIHHNQLLMTKFGRILCLTRK